MAETPARCPVCLDKHDAGACPNADLVSTRAQHAVSQVAIGATQLGESSLPLVEPPPPEELTPGMLVGEYEVVRRIGEGGMGTVYQAVHPLIGRKVAIKVLSATGGASAQSGARFLQEARTASMLRHRNIVDVFAFGQLVDGRMYLIMEFLEGETLADYLARRGPLSFAAASSILEGVFAGLQLAHARGVVHRDLKPDNIWLLPVEGAPADGESEEPEVVDPLRVKLLDFGIAKITQAGGGAQLTRAGTPMGTPAFMSPEQCRGDVSLDARSDIYAMGVVLYEMFTLRVPFSAGTFVEVLHQHLTAEPPSLDDSGMPDELQDVILTALEKDPAARYQTIGAMREALLSCEAARGFVPRRPARETTADEHATHAGEEVPGELSAGALPSLQVGGMTVHARLDDGTLRLDFEGELEDGPEVRALAGYLGDSVETTQDQLDRVVINIAAIGYLGPQGTQCLGGWIDFLSHARDDGMGPTTVIHDGGVGWQRAAAASWQRVDPALRIELS